MIDYRLRHALDTIELTYGDVCDIKAKSLLKFGSNELIGTSYATIETQPIASPSKPSVRFTAFDVPIITSAEKNT